MLTITRSIIHPRDIEKNLQIIKRSLKEALVKHVVNSPSTSKSIFSRINSIPHFSFIFTRGIAFSFPPCYISRFALYNRRIYLWRFLETALSNAKSSTPVPFDMPISRSYSRYIGHRKTIDYTRIRLQYVAMMNEMIAEVLLALHSRKSCSFPREIRIFTQNARYRKYHEMAERAARRSLSDHAFYIIGGLIRPSNRWYYNKRGNLRPR